VVSSRKPACNHIFEQCSYDRDSEQYVLCVKCEQPVHVSKCCTCAKCEVCICVSCITSKNLKENSRKELEILDDDWEETTEKFLVDVAAEMNKSDEIQKLPTLRASKREQISRRRSKTDHQGLSSSGRIEQRKDSGDTRNQSGIQRANNEQRPSRSKNRRPKA
jgi:hypothetical protein